MAARKPFLRPHRGDVSDPGAIRLAGAEVASYYIPRDWAAVCRVCRLSETTLPPRLDAVFPHESLHSLPGDTNACGSERSVDTGATIGAAATSVHGHDLSCQLGVGALSRGLGPSAPGVEAASRDAQHATQQRDRVERLLSQDEVEFHLLSLAKKAAAFLRNSNAGWCLDKGITQVLSSPPQVVKHTLPVALLVVVGSRVVVL